MPAAARGKQTKVTKHGGQKAVKKALKVKGGTASRYTTRNAALNRLQLKLADFRRLCILKGIHPREPKKKVKGQGKTYYHVKDINFLAHEPLLDKFRALRAYERKIKKAKAKKAYHAVDRLEERKPQYGLDHLVKERYPSFGDALRDFDDPLTLTHLFALLPADKRHGIPSELVNRARDLALEFQAYVTKTHSLRKVFISVKGIYYQALVNGQEVTWLTPHALAQTLPEDVDYRVMLTFLEFYLAMMGFVNYKLYHDNALRYPPVLDTRLEDNAAGIVAVIHNIAEHVVGGKKRAVTAAKKSGAQAVETAARMATLDFSKLSKDDEDEEAAAAKGAGSDCEGEGDDDNDDDAAMEDAIAEAAGLDPVQREDAKTCSTLFKGLVFFLNREVPRDMMVFIIRSFGGEVCWDGEGSPYDEKDGGVTHHVCDRPMVDSDRKKHREYVQPQWVVDCANWRVLIPVAAYEPGKPPPPHLSPFVNADDEGYTPDYQQTLLRLKAQAKAAREGRSLADDEEGGDAQARLLTEEEEQANEEKQYAKELSKETSGIPYSRSLQKGDESGSDDESDEESDGEEDEELQGDAQDDSDDDEDDDDENSDDDAPPKKRKASKLTAEMAMRSKDITINKRIKDMGEEEEMDAMRHVLLPRKKRELYRAMQLGLAKKESRADELKGRKEKLKAEGKYGHGDDGEKDEKVEAKKPASRKKK